MTKFATVFNERYAFISSRIFYVLHSHLRPVESGLSNEIIDPDLRSMGIPACVFIIIAEEKTDILSLESEKFILKAHCLYRL